MRKAFLIAMILAVWSTVPGISQQPWPFPTPYPPPTTQHRRGIPTPPLEPGPVYDASSLGAPMVLDKGWRVGISSDPAAASPDFDDSSWAVRDAAATIPEVPEPPDNGGPGGGGPHGGGRPGGGAGPGAGDPGGGGPGGDRGGRYAWFRLHIKLAPNHLPIALLIELPVSRSTALGIGSPGMSINVYANGTLAQPDGPHGSDPEHYQQITRMYKLDVPPTETSVTLAIRTIDQPLGFNAYTSFFATRTLRLGYPGDLQRGLLVWNDGTLFERIPRLVYSIVLFVLAGFLFALYFAQKGHNEYLWLAMHELVQAPIGFVELAGSTGRLDVLWYAALALQLLLVSAYLFFEFLMSFLTLKRRWYSQTLRYTAPVLMFVGPTLLLVGRSEAIGIVLAIVFVCSLLWLLGWLVFMFVTLIAATVRHNFEAGLLLVPLAMTVLGSIEPAITAGMNEITDHPEQSPLTIFAGPIPIRLAAIADFTGILAIVIIIFLRFLRIQRDQQRATSELAAARTVQELMIPQDKVATPGFEVDAVYSPANEVGGDFYHVQTFDDGGLLVVIGDVAGKGLTAAMNVSTIMGALRTMGTQQGTCEMSPAQILASLNRVLTGHESFTTCQAAWFGEDGELVLANAGHLPPYLNSQEIEIPGGLPLGVIPETNYEEMRIYLHPGDRVLLHSDGVVEARRTSGELFGFDRLHNLSNQSAFYIADAAKDFGQLDDITVLTVRRLAQPVPAESPALAALGRLQSVVRPAS